MPQTRCELSDLIADQCHHCTTGTRNLGPAWVELWDEPMEETGD